MYPGDIEEYLAYKASGVARIAGHDVLTEPLACRCAVGYFFGRVAGVTSAPDTCFTPSAMAAAT